MHILHDKEVFFCVSEEFIHPHDMGMIELGLNISFTPESDSQLIVVLFGKQNWPDTLHNHIARQADVARAVHDAHTTVGNFTGDDVIADLPADQLMKDASGRLASSRAGR